MNKPYSFYFIAAILVFHVFASFFATYSMYSDYEGWTIYHAYPIVMWLLTACWFGVFKGHRWCAFAYFMLLFFELANRLFFGQYDYGKALGSILFPIDLVFAFVILALYRQHFGDRKTD
jgi:hypothetical protein